MSGRALLTWVALGAALVLVLPLALAYLVLRASLPPLDGRIGAAGIAAPVSIERDARGVPTIEAANRLDLAFGTGFVHGQDRFFAMDLSRRLAAGELSELFGDLALPHDRKARLFGFRGVARQALAQATPEQRALLEAYARGVNAGVASLEARPWEYWALRAAPVPWSPEDSFLIVYAMWWDLQYGELEREVLRRTLNEALGGPDCADGWRCALHFLYPARTQWDSPNVADERELQALERRDAGLSAIPDAQALNVREAAPAEPATLGATVARAAREPARGDGPLPWDGPTRTPGALGSNNWAVAGRLSAYGAAIVANDMHLGLRVPPVWYRARLRVRGARGAAIDLNGVTLPGTPVLAAGSNGHVAWGFTNSYGHYLEVRPRDCTSVGEFWMRTPQGEDLPLESSIARIHVRGAREDDLDRVLSSPDGVLFAFDEEGHRCWFVQWLAQLPAATNLNLLEFEHAMSVQELRALAPRLGIPHQNLMAADSAGGILWTIAGRIPQGTGAERFAGHAWLSEANPNLLAPELGRLWSANARPTDDESGLAALGGDEAGLGAGYDLGARARQIRDALLALRAPVRTSDMLRIQLDDRALFLARWQRLIVRLLDAEALRSQPRRAEFARLVAGWDAHAGVDSVGYRLVRAFRTQTEGGVWHMILAALRIEAQQPPPPQFEQPLWTLIERQPLHMLAARYPSWRAFLLEQVDASIATLRRNCGTLERCRWGARHPVAIRHPLSAALPFLRWLINMPMLELPGDHDMPRVQDTDVGASERFAVAPGHEAEGYLTIAGGQSDHPLSAYYRAGFAEWAQGRPVPLLPGSREHELVLQPGSTGR